MSKTKLSVETPYGVVTRTTEREYKFVVVSFGRSESFLRSRHEAGVAYATKLAAEYRKHEAAGGFQYSTAEQYGEWAAQREATAAKAFVMPEAELSVHGWSGSLKGASKMAADAANYGHLGIEIVPVGAGK